jgi:outer membrane immunogenic protein
MPVRKYLPSASVIALAWMAVTPALADDLFAAPLSDGWYNNLLTEPRAPVGVPAKYSDWRGLYAGGQLSYTDAFGDFSSATGGPIAYTLRETDLETTFAPSSWPVLGSANHGGFGGGGFVGYNFEYLTPDLNVVLGFEANFNIAQLSINSPSSSIARALPTDAAGNSYDVTLTGGGQVSNLDWSTLRARVGCGVDRFLPYAFVGFALGDAKIGTAETISVVQCTPACVTLPPATASQGKDSTWLYGVTVGAGLDIAVSRNFFMRTEYEYVQFQPVSGVNIETNTVRLGGGVRF